jgi:16S rRNA (cytosine1402-N4)-methyltransferase
VHEVLEGLQCHHQGIFLDCTVGCGGHAAAILAQHPQNRVIGIDRDAEALQFAGERLRQFGERVTLYHERFENVEKIVRLIQVGDRLPSFDGILFDLGVSSLQLDDAERGFSFRHSGRLDMRMDRQDSGKNGATTAYEVVNRYSVEQLAHLFFRYGEERQSRRIAKKVVEARAKQPIETTTQLAEIIVQAVPRRFQAKGIHPATRVFQAIRIEVNRELQGLGATLERAVAYLGRQGRICVIAFHSLEDRIVKRTFAKLAQGCQCPPTFPVCVCGIQPSLRRVSKKPRLASEEEQTQNPRSRSAKLRIAEKLMRSVI